MTGADRDALIQAHLPMLRAIAAEMWKKHPRHAYGDLFGAGAVGLCQAAARFRPGGRAFSSYAWTRVCGAIVDWMRRDGRWSRGQIRRRAATGVDEVTFVGMGALALVASAAPLADELLADSETLSRARTRIAAMPLRTRELMDLIYVEGLDGQATGERLGVTKTWVCRLRQEAIRELQEAA